MQNASHAIREEAPPWAWAYCLCIALRFGHHARQQRREMGIDVPAPPDLDAGFVQIIRKDDAGQRKRVKSELRASFR